MLRSCCWICYALPAQSLGKLYWEIISEVFWCNEWEREIAWKKAIYSDDFIDIEGIKVPNQKTNVKLLRDENYLFVFAKIYENHIWGDIINRDEVIYFNNDFEIFINEDGEARFSI